MSQPLWYYFHISAQFIGVILGLTGVAVGIQLNNKLQPHIPGHQGIGILIFVLSILQVLAFFVRTDKDSKYRKYWNLYHSWMGIALFFGAVNIVSGMHYEGAGQGWKIGYGFVLGSTMLACIILETLLRLKKLDEPTLCLSERLLELPRFSAMTHIQFSVLFNIGTWKLFM